MLTVISCVVWKMTVGKLENDCGAKGIPLQKEYNNPSGKICANRVMSFIE